jgi:tetratricopeptide (TPR) repeat protein
MAPRRPRTAIVRLFLTTALLAPGLVGCHKPTSPAQTPSPPPVAESIGKPLTEEECLAAGEAIAQAARSGDAAAFDRIIDWAAINQRATGGVDAPEKHRLEFIKGLDGSRASGKGVSFAIVDAVRRGGSYTLLHSHTRKNRHYLLFRLLLPEAGVNYHDLPIARRLDGSVKAMDMYVYLSGEPISDTFRRAYIQSAAQANTGLIDRLTGADQKFVQNFGSLGKMAKANRDGKFSEALGIYKGLPAELKKQKSILLVRLQAAQHLDDTTEYTQSIEDYRREHPNDPSVDILSIDYHIIKRQYSEALACVDRLDQAIQGDPYLQTIRATIHAEQGDLTAARADLDKAIAAEPDLVDAYWGLVNLSLKAKDHEATLKTLRLIRDKFQLDMSDLTEMPVYQEFTRSSQFLEWLKDKPPVAEGKQAAEKPKE